ncbi:MAG: PilZ domain-containing protein [Thermoleophilia bacterium]
MTLFLARREAGGPGPLPLPGTEVWLEDLPMGPLGTIVSELRGDRIRLEPPRLGGNEVALAPGRELAITYSAGEVPCEARVITVTADPDDAPGLWLHVREVSRMQRRSAVRVPVQLIARLLPDGAPADAAVAEVLESGVTEDLSASGVLVRLSDPVDVGGRARLVIHCGGDVGDVEVVATVVRVDREDRSARPYRAALTFPDIDREAESRLVKFLFERQRVLRRRASGME